MKFKLTTVNDAHQPVIAKILKDLQQKKEKAVEIGNETLANDCWREAEALKLNIQYIKFFEKIKARKYRDAWQILERCEIKASFIEKNSSTEFFIKSRGVFIREKVCKWQSLFPYCMFFSPCFTVEYYTCSICGHKIRPRSRCSHVKGRIYNGDLCVHMAHGMSIKEVSLVSKPVQKYSVIHNDETLDFSLVDYLADLLENPFEDWDIVWTRMSFPIEMFSQLNPSAECPCKSGKNFEACCIKKQEVSIPHVDFVLSKKIPEGKAEIYFPY